MNGRTMQETVSKMSITQIAIFDFLMIGVLDEWMDELNLQRQIRLNFPRRIMCTHQRFANQHRIRPGF